jgi:hypothetical protein
VRLTVSRRFALLAVATAFATLLPRLSWLWPCPSSHLPPWVAHGIVAPVMGLILTAALLAPGCAFARWWGVRGTIAHRLAASGLFASLWAMTGGVVSGLVLSRLDGASRALFETSFALVPVVAAWWTSRSDDDTLDVKHALPYLVPIVFIPVAWGAALFAREFTSDGLESYVLGRALDVDPFPTFLTPSGGAGLGSGGYLQAYLIHAHFPFLADTEAVARWLAVTASPILVASIVDAVERDDAAPDPWTCAAAVTTGIAILGLHATFDPHLADPASPAAWDVPATALLVALAARLRVGDLRMVALLAALTALARPSGPLIAVSIGITAWLTSPTERRMWITRVVVAVATAMLTVFVVERVLLPMFRPGSEGYLASGGLLKRLRAVTWDGQHRWWWILAASGGALLPALTAILRPVHARARTFAIAGLATGLFFTLTRGFAPHHVMPAVALLAVAAAYQVGASTSAKGLAVVGLVAAGYAAWPSAIAAPSPARNLGAHIAVHPTFLDAARARPAWARPYPRREGFSAFADGRGTLLSGAGLADWRAVADAMAPLVRLPFEPVDEGSLRANVVGLMPIVAAVYAHVAIPDETTIGIGPEGRLVSHPSRESWTRAPSNSPPTSPLLRIPHHALFPTNEPRVGVDCDVDFGMLKKRLLGS